MKITTKGKCTKCGELYSPEEGSEHLAACAVSQPSQSMTQGYLVHISWAERPNLYWMFVTIPKNVSLELLDKFLRDVWLECCGHLSCFTICGRFYMSHPEPGSQEQSMDIRVDRTLSPGLKFKYVYDMGFSTDLTLQVTKKVTACPQKKVTLLMQNDPLAFPCKSCEKAADTICSLCGETACSTCCKKHSCAVSERDTYMLMPLVNSPRAGVCGYVGK